MAEIRDLSDAAARHVLRLTWGTVPDDVIPAWVAEMDYALAPVVHEALRRALDDEQVAAAGHLQGSPTPSSG